MSRTTCFLAQFFVSIFFWQISSLKGTGEAASFIKEFLSGADQPLINETTETTELKPQELQILEKEGGNSNLSLSRILGGQGGLGWVQGAELSLNLSFIPFSYFDLTKCLTGRLESAVAKLGADPVQTGLRRSMPENMCALSDVPEDYVKGIDLRQVKVRTSKTVINW